MPKPALQDVAAVTALALDLPAGHRFDWHSHDRGQLIFAAEGLMRVGARAATEGEWLLPSPQALWMPAGVPHQITVLRSLAMRTLYLDEAALPPASRARLRGCRVVPVSSLLRALVLRLAATSPRQDHGKAKDEMRTPPDPRRERLLAVLLDELSDLPSLPLTLPVPADARLRRVTDALRQNPGDGRRLPDWAALAGASPRSLARLFAAETGLSFGAWRQQARLLQAIAWLADDRPVTSIALDLGYDSPSAFISVFKKAFGVTPGRYFAKRGGGR